MASSVSSQGLRFPRTLLPSPPKPRPRLHSSTRAASLVRSPSTLASVCSLGPVRRSDAVRSRVVARASASGIGPDISDVLGDVRVFTAAGEPVLFKDLWDQNEGVAVVAMLRHFGCICCWELASALKESKAKFDSAGVKLIAVGVGTPDKARILAERSKGFLQVRDKIKGIFVSPNEKANAHQKLSFRLTYFFLCHKTQLPFPMDCLYADPDRESYDVLGLYYGLGRTFFNPASAKVFSRFDSIQKAAKNYTIGATPDDRSSVLQQGGMLVFKGRQLLYARKDEGTGDHAPLDDVFDACCKVPV